MSKFISKQSVAIWYALTALLATYIVGQVILWCFPDRKVALVTLYCLS